VRLEFYSSFTPPLEYWVSRTLGNKPKRIDVMVSPRVQYGMRAAERRLDQSPHRSS